MIASLLPLLLAASAAAHPDPQGVWRGTLGKAAVMACFDEYSGTYYYESRRHDIDLQGDEGSATLLEKSPGPLEESTGSWVIASTGPELVATWTSPDGKRSLPIRMTRLARLGEQESCFESRAYNEPRLASAPLSPPVVKTERGLTVRRQKVLDADLERLQVEIAGPVGERINADLRKEFRDLLGSAYSCVDFSSGTALQFVDTRWIVVQESAGLYCGGAHPDDFVRVIVYSRTSGQRVDTSQWLSGEELQAEDSRLWKLLARKAAPEADCADAWQGGAWASLHLYPSAGGLTFRSDFPHVVSACEDEVELSLEEAAPYLTAAAKRELAPRR